MKKTTVETCFGRVNLYRQRRDTQSHIKIAVCGVKMASCGVKR